MKFFIVLVVLFFSTNLLADPWSSTTEIKWLYPNAAGLTFISEYSNTAISSCDSGRRFRIDITHANYQVMASALMAAFMAGKSIKFNIDSDQELICSPTINRFHVYE